ncbi:MAG: AmmeMemoRadiSam system radical SAM enzyme [Ignavibacteriae bacterium]|nr:AmmeMemoRadiSam system radical SAM enzyme [Ignavibacteriota bacterium]
MKEALFYENLEGGKIKCTLCPRGCVVADTRTGTCGVRENVKGKLYSLIYEKPVAINVDPIEKKPLYHFYPGAKILSIGTYGCNLDCKFCQNYDLSQEFEVSDFEYIENVEPEMIIKTCLEKNIKFVAFTYNEPTIFYEYMLDIAKLCKANGIKTVSVSNGQINENPLRELINYIDAFNIDLKAFNNDFYKKICGGDLQTTLDTLKIIVDEKKHLEVTFLLIEGFNDDVIEFRQMCDYINSLGNEVVFHISRAFPRYKLEYETTPIPLLKKFGQIAKEYIKHVYIGNV